MTPAVDKRARTLEGVTAVPPDTTPHPPLRLERDGHVVSLILNRAERANAFTEEMWEGLPALVEQAGAMAADGARVLVVRSAAERAFSAGADLEEYRAHADDAEWGLGNHDRVTRALDAVRDSALPTVAVIAGACVGGGAGLAVACDLRVCSDDSVFAITPARLGLVYPYADTLALVQLIGPAAARRMLLTGARFDAEWALRVGLVDAAVPRADLAGRHRRPGGRARRRIPGRRTRHALDHPLGRGGPAAGRARGRLGGDGPGPRVPGVRRPPRGHGGLPRAPAARLLTDTE